MLVGIMSDSHDNFPDLLGTVKLFQARGVELILHAGDIIAPGMCYAFQGCRAQVKIVFGNNDGDRIGIKRDFQMVGAECLEDFGELEIDGLRIALLHGTYEPLVRGLLNSGNYDIIVRGHNHTYCVEKGRTLVINPGELWGHFTGYKSAAILDTSNLKVERMDVGRVASIKEILQS
jgi:putative phosphoesterase